MIDCRTPEQIALWQQNYATGLEFSREAHCRYCPGEENDPRLKCKRDIESDAADFAAALLRARADESEDSAYRFQNGSAAEALSRRAEWLRATIPPDLRGWGGTAVRAVLYARVSKDLLWLGKRRKRKWQILRQSLKAAVGHLFPGRADTGVPLVDRTARVLTDGSPVTPDHREINPATGQQKGYVALSAEERAKGFVRPVRRMYTHLTCLTDTTMGLALAETYARDPGFYSGTFCCGCRAHLPLVEFVWAGTMERLGS